MSRSTHKGKSADKQIDILAFQTQLFCFQSLLRQHKGLSLFSSNEALFFKNMFTSDFSYKLLYKLNN